MLVSRIVKKRKDKLILSLHMACGSTDGKRRKRRNKVGATRKRTGGKGLRLPLGTLLSEVGHS